MMVAFDASMGLIVDGDHSGGQFLYSFEAFPTAEEWLAANYRQAQHYFVLAEVFDGGSRIENLMMHMSNFPGAVSQLEAGKIIGMGMSMIDQDDLSNNLFEGDFYFPGLGGASPTNGEGADSLGDFLLVDESGEGGGTTAVVGKSWARIKAAVNP